MDLVDLIAQKKWLAQEFLTWLWFRADVSGFVETVDSTNIDIIFEGKMSLEYGEGEAYEELICNGHSELQESRKALALGKKIERASFYLIQGEHEFKFTFVASLFEFRSVVCPKMMAVSDDDELAGASLDKLGLLNMVYDSMISLLQTFMEYRANEATWAVEHERMCKWVGGGA